MKDLLKSSALTVIALSIVGAVGCQSERTFSTPDEAVAALTTAVQDENSEELHAIFGPRADQLKTGDPDLDRDDFIIFSRRLQETRILTENSPNEMTLLIGQEQWPFAVPLVKVDNAWHFDTDAGIEELINRRIGRNELRTIQACNTVIDAQAEFYERDPDGLGVKHYAQRLMSTEGKKDGLYWDSPGGVDPSPIGPVLAEAAVRRDEKGERIPFYGYRYKLLHGQGPSSPGGAMEYTENGQYTRGWAALAYPAEYATTGIMTFLFGNTGVIYQKDLGDDTDMAVAGMETFDLGNGWLPIGPD